MLLNPKNKSSTHDMSSQEMPTRHKRSEAQLHHGAELADRNNVALLGIDTIEQCAMFPYKWQYPATPKAIACPD
jgi:hypothetical protein